MQVHRVTDLVHQPTNHCALDGSVHNFYTTSFLFFPLFSFNLTGIAFKKKLMEIEFVPLLHYIYLLEGKSYSGGSDSSEMWADEKENTCDVI